MSTLIWLVLILLVCAAVLGVVKALFRLSIMAPLAEFTGVIYAVIVLVMILYVVSIFYGGGPLVVGPRHIFP